MKETHSKGDPYPYHKKVISRKPKKRRRYPQQSLKPSKDPSLTKVFLKIGTPEKKPFEPDPFQIRSLEVVRKSDCLVTVPTGAGKTWIAVEAIAEIFESGGKSWYASPLKALTNSKYIEFSERFGASNVGILTGDRKENFDAPIVIGTTEILRNQLYDAMHRGEDLNAHFVVLDEAHFLGDSDRGVVWEEVMIYLPKRIPLLLLSATIGNAHKIAAWLSYIRDRECVVIEESERPVPLFQMFLHPTGKLLPLLEQRKSQNKRLNSKVLKYLNNPIFFSNPRALPPLGDVMNVLREYDLLPAIFFLKSRLDCNRGVEMCYLNKDEPQERRNKRIQWIDQLIKKYPILSVHKQLQLLKNYAVGAHHSGQLPAWKIVIETLMTEGLLDAVFATSTVAAGVNFPARTVVFLNSDRYNGHDFVSLDATEFHQMTGRAGRRGADQIGFAVTIPGKFMNIQQIAELAKSPPSNVLSQIKINFSMVLNLLLSHTPEEIRLLLQKSFATYLIMKERKLSHKRKKEARTRLWREFIRHLNFLIKEGFVNEDELLTNDGKWTSQLRVDQPLLIAEGIRKHVFPQDDPVLFAAMITPFVNEREWDDSKIIDMADENLLKAFSKMVTELRPLAKRMNMNGFLARPLFLHPAVTIFTWANGATWDEVVTQSEMTEGDLAMLIMRTVDNIRHIGTLTEEFPVIAELSNVAIDLILREPVIMDIRSIE